MCSVSNANLPFLCFLRREWLEEEEKENQQRKYLITLTFKLNSVNRHYIKYIFTPYYI